MASRTCVIEINDAGLAIADADGLRLVSPGYAVAEGEHLQVGAPAYARSRLNPRATHDRFWTQLDQQPLSRPAGPARSHADIAYFHLQAVWSEAGAGYDEALLAVPAGMDKERLALLLGIAQAARIPVAGLVAAGVASAAGVADERPRLVIDVELHRSTAERIDVDDGLSLAGSRELAKRGLAGLYDAWAGLIAERFVRETRFDPLHDANTEQLLYDRMPSWLQALRGQAVLPLELPAGMRTHRIEIERADLAASASALYQPLIEAAAAAGDALILVTDRAARLPGLMETLAQRASAPVLALPPGVVGRVVLAHADAIRSDAGAPAYVTRLPGSIDDAAPAPAGAAAGPAPSHLLHRCHAYAIGETPLLLNAGAPRPLTLGEAAHGCIVVARGGEVVLEAPESAEVNVNGRQVSGTLRLVLGDIIRVAGGEDIRLIAQVGPVSRDAP